MIWTPIHLVWKNPMWMKWSGPWGSTLPRQQYWGFLKEFIGEFWCKWWILFISFWFLVWPWLNKYVLLIHPFNFFTCYTSDWDNHVDAKRGWCYAKLGYTSLVIVASWTPRGIYMGVWKDVGDVGVLGPINTPSHSTQ